MESRRDKDLSWREDKWWWLVRVPQVKSILGSVSPPRDSGGLVRLSEESVYISNISVIWGNP